MQQNVHFLCAISKTEVFRVPVSLSNRVEHQGIAKFRAVIFPSLFRRKGIQHPDHFMQPLRGYVSQVMPWQQRFRVKFQQLFKALPVGFEGNRWNGRKQEYPAAQGIAGQHDPGSAVISADAARRMPRCMDQLNASAPQVYPFIPLQTVKPCEA